MLIGVIRESFLSSPHEEARGGNRPRLRRRAAALGAALLVALLTVTGCSPTVFPDLEREATPADALPREVTESFVGLFQPESARLIGTYAEKSVFLAYGTIAPVCLLVIDLNEPSTVCGGPQLSLAFTDVEFKVITPIDDTPSGWEEFSTNVIVKAK